MRVHVDPAGRDQKPIGVDVAPRRSLLAADPNDPAARNRNVAGEGRLSAAIDNGATANDDIVHAGLRVRGRYNAPQRQLGQCALTHVR